MCDNSISLIISNIYLIISIGIPIFYLISYKFYKCKHKNWGKAFIIAFIILILFLSIKGIAFLTGNNSFNCYINNICECEEKMNKIDNKNTTDNIDKTTSNTTSTITDTKTTNNPTTSMKTTNRNTTTVANNDKYQRIPEPNGFKQVIGKSSKGYDIYTIDGVTYVNGFLIANKTYALPRDFVPKNTKNTTTTPEKSCQDCINIKAYEAFQVMKADALAAGIKLWIQSGYRSYILQNNLYNRYVARDGKTEADTYSARPGHSEHQSGECFDLNDAGRAFNGTAAAKWVNQNASKYGFIIRYPEGKTNETGYIYESWHLRYVGTDLSQKLFNNGDWITMENYFGLTSQYAN